MNDVRGWLARRSLFDEVYAQDTLARAWQRVRSANGAPGTDGVSIAAFEADWAANSAQLARELREGTYLPGSPRRFSVPKTDGSSRTVAALTVRDRLAQRAVHTVMEPLFEARFLPCSYAYRPRRNTAQAVASVLEAGNAGHVWLVDADIAAFFDELDHRLLMDEVGRMVRDKRLLRLLDLWLAAGMLAASDGAARTPHGPAAGQIRDVAGEVLDWGLRGLSGQAWAEDGTRPMPLPAHVEALRRTASGLALLALAGRDRAGAALGTARARRRGLLTVGGSAAAGAMVASALPALARLRRGVRCAGVGTAQGGILSPLLSNMYLHPLDVAMSSRYPRYVRYADNVLIPCHTEAEAHEALVHLRRALATLRLRVREEKTSVHPFGVPFTFLGYRFAGGTADPPVPRTEAVTAGLREARHKASGAARQGLARADNTARRTATTGRRALRRARAATQSFPGQVRDVAKSRQRHGGERRQAAATEEE